MIGNICSARWARSWTKLPHEPFEPKESWGVRFEVPIVNTRLATGEILDYFLCRHCGSIYGAIVESDTAKEQP